MTGNHFSSIRAYLLHRMSEESRAEFDDALRDNPDLLAELHKQQILMQLERERPQPRLKMPFAVPAELALSAEFEATDQPGASAGVRPTEYGYPPSEPEPITLVATPPPQEESIFQEMAFEKVIEQKPSAAEAETAPGPSADLQTNNSWLKSPVPLWRAASFAVFVAIVAAVTAFQISKSIEKSPFAGQVALEMPSSGENQMPKEQDFFTYTPKNDPSQEWVGKKEASPPPAETIAASPPSEISPKNKSDTKKPHLNVQTENEGLESFRASESRQLERQFAYVQAKFAAPIEASKSPTDSTLQICQKFWSEGKELQAIEAARHFLSAAKNESESRQRRYYLAQMYYLAEAEREIKLGYCEEAILIFDALHDKSNTDNYDESLLRLFFALQTKRQMLGGTLPEWQRKKLCILRAEIEQSNFIESDEQAKKLVAEAPFPCKQ